MDGMEATKEVRKRFDAMKVLVTMYDDDKFIIHLNGCANGIY